MSDTNKIIDRIRKCLALSKSANEHEAAAALRQAQKLMAAYNLTEEDVGLANYVGELVVTDHKWSRKKPIVVTSVITLMMHAFGVEATYEADGNMLAVRYWGERSRVALAAYAHEVVYRAAGRAYRKDVGDNRPARGYRAGFYHGWCLAVKEKVEAIALNDEERSKIDAKKRAHYGRELVAAPASKQRVFQSAINAGAAAAADFSLHRPITPTRRALPGA